MMEGQSPVPWVVLWPLHTSYAVCMPFAGVQQVYECDFQKEGKKKPWSGLEFSTSSRPGRLQCAQPLRSRWTVRSLSTLYGGASPARAVAHCYNCVKWTVRSTQLSVTSDTKELERRSSNSSSCESGRPEFKSLALQSLPWLAWAYNHVVGWQVPVRACIKNVQQWASLMHVPRHVDGHAALHTPEREVLAARWCPCFLVVFPFQHWLEPKARHPWCSFQCAVFPLFF